jgi:hypothetical protein
METDTAVDIDEDSHLFDEILAARASASIATPEHISVACLRYDHGRILSFNRSRTLPRMLCKQGLKLKSSATVYLLALHSAGAVQAFLPPTSRPSSGLRVLFWLLFSFVRASISMIHATRPASKGTRRIYAQEPRIAPGSKPGSEPGFGVLLRPRLRQPLQLCCSPATS